MGSIYCEVKTMNGKGVKTMGVGKNKCQCTVFNNVTDRNSSPSIGHQCGLQQRPFPHNKLEIPFKKVWVVGVEKPVLF